MKASKWLEMISTAIAEHGDMELLIRDVSGKVQIFDPSIKKVRGRRPSEFLTVSGHDFPDEANSLVGKTLVGEFKIVEHDSPSGPGLIDEEAAMQFLSEHGHSWKIKE
jgi:hypothetical protein